jgi:hypothetical protein
MERQIVVEPLQKEFTLDIKDAFRQKRATSFASASPNSTLEKPIRLVQKKFDAESTMTDDRNKWREVSESQVTHKIVKIGKEEHLIPKDVLEKATEFGSDKLKIHTILRGDMPVEAKTRICGVMYGHAKAKREGEYTELAEILKGRYAVGTIALRSNEFQVVMTADADGKIQIFKLADESQMYDEPIVPLFEVNKEIVELERQILDAKAVESFDFGEFRDSRVQTEEKIIEEFVMNGELPEIVTQKMEENKQENELERLKALANGG